jgi:hypothetical protein
MTAPATMRDLIATVTRSLSEDVLPHVEGGWVAANLRACVMVLTHLEDRAEHERLTLLQDSSDMRAVLTQAVNASLDTDGKIAELLAKHPRRVDIPTSLLQDENGFYREAVTNLIHKLSELRSLSSASGVREQLRACIKAMQVREYAMMQRAEKCPPI